MSRLIVSYVTYSAPPALWLFSHGVRRWWQHFWPLEDSGTASLSLALGFILPLFANRLSSRRWAKEIALKGHHSALIRLLHHANYRKRAIAVTLDNKKWYAGMVLDSPNLDPQESHFRLLPLLSGHRSSENMKVRVVTTYYKFPEDSRIQTP